MEDGRTERLEYLLLGDVSAREKKPGFVLWTNSKGSHPVPNKEPSPVVACIENAVTVKCHKEGYVEQRAYFYLLRKPAVYIGCNELLQLLM
jgi:isopentenyldiphosphate isomerase